KSGFGNLAGALVDGGRASTASRARHRGRQVLVATQVALALVLLVGAGLLARSFQNLVRVDPGLEATADATSFDLSLPESKYADASSAARFFEQLEERLGAVPGVEGVAITNGLPLSGNSGGKGHALEGEPTDESSLPPVFRVEHVSPSYARTLGLRILAGRDLRPEDAAPEAAHVLVSRSLAERHWPGQDPLGKRITPGRTPDEEVDDPWYTVVGVVGDVFSEGLQSEAPLTVYYPILPKLEDDWAPVRRVSVVVRSAAPHAEVVAAARQAVWSLDGDLPLSHVETLAGLLDDARSRLAFTLLMLMVAASVALGLGAVGTYGVVSYLVAQRTSEIGVRMALGARRGQVTGMVLRQGTAVALVGTAVGLLGAVGLSRWMETLLFEVKPLDPGTFAVVPLVLLAVTLVATLVPAIRASRIDPMEALRKE
ncbi:MAG: ABC transporter permease, partial [Holophagales bacterium]|nr:ABC transporter permease [Holophagales bacterium]